VRAELIRDRYTETVVNEIERIVQKGAAAELCLETNLEILWLPETRGVRQSRNSGG